MNEFGNALNEEAHVRRIVGYSKSARYLLALGLVLPLLAPDRRLGPAESARALNRHPGEADQQRRSGAGR